MTRRILVTDPADPPADGELLAYDSGTDAVTGVPDGGPVIGESDLASPFTAIDVDVTEDASNGPFRLIVGGNEFAGRYDPTLSLGYNFTATGGLAEAGEPSFILGIEADYDDGSARFMESYLQFTSADGLTFFRPWFTKVDRASPYATTLTLTADTHNWIDTDGTQLMQRTRDRLSLLSVTGQSTALYMYAPASQVSIFRMGSHGTDDVFRIQTNNASVNESYIYHNAQKVLTLYSNPNGSGLGAALAIGNVADNSAVLLAAVASSHTSVKGIVARGKASQAASLLEVQDSASAILSRFDKDGYFMTRKVAAPADAALASSEAAFWYDAANGVGALWAKAKTVDGTVVTRRLDNESHEAAADPHAGYRLESADHTHASTGLQGGSALTPVTVDASTSIKTDLLAEHTGSAGISISHNPFPTTDSATDLGKSGKTWQHVWAEGIQFPATQVASANANNLDDYEEGTWTAGIAFSGASAGTTYSLQAGHYTKWGRRVDASFQVNLSAKGSSTGDLQITGLPFTSAGANGAGLGSMFRIAYGLTGLTGAPMPSIANATTYATVYQSYSAGWAVALTQANVTDTSVLAGSISYTV